MYQCDVSKPAKVIAELHCLETYLPEVREVQRAKLVQDTIAQCKQFQSSRIRELNLKEKQPLTINMMETVLACTDTSYDFYLFKTMLLIGFHGLLKLSALCEQSLAKKMRRISVECPSPHSISFMLPTGNDREENLVIIRNIWAELDVTSIFRQYLENRDHHFPYHFQLWLRENGTVPDRSFFLTYLKSFNFSLSVRGPSMRAGGATALAESGVSSNSIQVLGRWSEKGWERYLRKHPTIVHLIIKQALRPSASGCQALEGPSA